LRLSRGWRAVAVDYSRSLPQERVRRWAAFVSTVAGGVTREYAVTIVGRFASPRELIESSEA